ncbi:sugar ABC transporter permease [Blautia producta]|uniref:Maltose transport system permease protein MalG n=1 Tax=Blautia producta TaxID=33035 RepID=A0A4P6LXM8_9FIRM|nr:sugar ABC transporter permease [Blautia producta]QBE97361.1 Maltose transport system permease protein MalG [Blautia producta]
MKKSGMVFTSILVWVFLIGTSLFVVYPLIYVAAAAFSPQQNIASLSVIPFGNGVTWKNFIYLFQNTDFPLWFRNTLIVAVATTISTVFICALSAYVFSRFRFVFKKSLMMSLLILQIFPSFVGMVAIYVILLRIGGLNTLWGLVLVYLAGNIPYNTWMVKSYLDTIPKSLDEAARIDGAGHFQIFAKVIMPVSKPIIVLLTITSFIAPWMDFIFPKLVLRSSNVQTIAQGLFGFVTEKKNMFATFSAGSLIIAVPFIIYFVVTQKTLITSLSGAAVKE